MCVLYNGYILQEYLSMHLSHGFVLQNWKSGILYIEYILQVYSSVIHELEAAVQMAPWTLTDNFISAMRENRGALALTGAGDPTARGEGFSYFKEPHRVSVLQVWQKRGIYVSVLTIFYTMMQ